MTATIRQRVSVTMSRAGNQPTELVTFDGLSDPGEHFACVVGDPGSAPLVRLHSECMTGDVFGSTRCDCGAQLDEALSRFADEGGILLYLRQEGRGIGLYNKIDAYELQDRDVDTFTANEILGRDADERRYDMAAQMLHALGVEQVELLTNNPDKIGQLQAGGVDVVERHRTGVHVTADNAEYLRAKREHGHSLDGRVIADEIGTVPEALAG